MKYKIGDNIPYIDGGFTHQVVMDQLPHADALVKYPDTFSSFAIPCYNEVVIYKDGWDWVENLVPAEIYYSPLYQIMSEDE